MEIKRIIELIDFVSLISITEEDVTTHEERELGEYNVIVTYRYLDKSYTTKKLHYKEIHMQEDVDDEESTTDFLGHPVYWLDIEKHLWPKKIGEASLEKIVIPDMINVGDTEFESFLKLLANDKNTGKIQQFTAEGKSSMFGRNLETNNHWHDLVLLIQAIINRDGDEPPKEYFKRLVFQWNQDGSGRVSLKRTNGRWAIIENLIKNIKKVQMEITKSEILKLLADKKQIILQGPPGTGKTRKAKEIAIDLTISRLPIKIDTAKIRELLISDLELTTIKEGYSFRVLRLDDSIRIKLLSTDTQYPVSYQRVIDCLANNDLEKDDQTSYNANVGPYILSIAKYIREQLSKSQRKLIQFHPAYSYEDFVRGISAKSTDDGIEYKTENRILGDFADTALTNLEDSQKTTDVISKENWLLNEIQDFCKNVVQKEIDTNEKYPLNDSVSIFDIDEDAFRYSGNNKITGDKWQVGHMQRMKFRDIILEYLADVQTRKDIKVVPGISGRAKEHCTYDMLLLQKFKTYLNGRIPPAAATDQKVAKVNYVLIIDEINRANIPAVLGELIYALEYRNESVESMYEIDGERNIILPENLYIIGTMNTADRSVGHIDYAIRRRFAFVDITPDFEVVKSIGSDKAQTLFKEVAKLFYKDFPVADPKDLIRNEFLASDFKPEDVMIGHSYFLEKDEAKLKNRLKYEIKPILKEYVKDGILNNNAEAAIGKLSV